MTLSLVTHLSLSLREPSLLLPSNTASHGKRETVTSTQRPGFMARRRKSHHLLFCIRTAERNTSPVLYKRTRYPDGANTRPANSLPSSHSLCSPRAGPLMGFPENGPCANVRMPREDRTPHALTSLPFAGSFAPRAGEPNLAGPSWLLEKSPPSKAYTTTKLCQKMDFGPSS